MEQYNFLSGFVRNLKLRTRLGVLVVRLEGRKLLRGVVFFVWIFQHPLYKLNLKVFDRSVSYLATFWRIAQRDKVLHAWRFALKTS